MKKLRHAIQKSTKIKPVTVIIIIIIYLFISYARRQHLTHVTITKTEKDTSS